MFRFKDGRTTKLKTLP